MPSQAHASFTRRQRKLRALALTHRPWIHYWARRYANGRLDCLDDLQQVGQLGLMTAFDRYQAGRGVPFKAYARHHIRGAMQHYLRDHWPLIRIPRVQQERLAALSNSHELELTQEQWRQLEQARLSLKLIALDPGDLDALGPSTASADLEDPDQTSRWLSWLEPRQAEVLRLVVLEGVSLRRAAAQLHSSASSVRRQLHAGLAELRTRLSPASGVAEC